MYESLNEILDRKVHKYSWFNFIAKYMVNILEIFRKSTPYIIHKKVVCLSIQSFGIFPDNTPCYSHSLNSNNKKKMHISKNTLRLAIFLPGSMNKVKRFCCEKQASYGFYHNVS